jgi:hypothetical protein
MVVLCKKWAETDLDTLRFDGKGGRPVVFNLASISWNPDKFLYPSYSLIENDSKRSQIQFADTTNTVHVALSQKARFEPLIAIFLTVSSVIYCSWLVFVANQACAMFLL